MSIPDRTAYSTSVLNLASTVTDSKLKKGSVRLRKGSNNPLLYSGGFAAVFVVDSEGEAYALKCWTHDIGDSRARYEAVTHHLQTLSLPYFVDFTFNFTGIQVGNRQYPTLRMRWVEEESLDEFVHTHISTAAFRNIAAAAETFRRMCADLAIQGMAHGDLQGANIKATMGASQVEMTLIDYDTMVVPALAGTPRSTTGSPHFQHPHIDAAVTVSARDDFFPSLCIYLSLHAIGAHPSLWQEFHREEGTLLFISDDFKSTSPTGVFLRLYALGGTIGRLAILLWNFKSCPNINLLLPLEEAIALASANTGTASPPTTSAPAKSGFDEFLQTKRIKTAPSFAAPHTANGWLDDSLFRTASAPSSPDFSAASGPDSYSPASHLNPADPIAAHRPPYAPPAPHPVVQPPPSFSEILKPAQSPSSPASSAPSSGSGSGSPEGAFIFFIVVLIVVCLIIMKSCGQ